MKNYRCDDPPRCEAGWEHTWGAGRKDYFTRETRARCRECGLVRVWAAASGSIRYIRYEEES